MPKIVFSLLLASCFFLAAGCKKENAGSINELLLNNTKWKVFETTYQFTDTTYSYRNDLNGGFYLNLNRNNEFIQEYYPYTFQIDGKWDYSASDKKLVLDYDATQFQVSYEVIKLSRTRLVISLANGIQGFSGYGTAIYELHPY